METEEEKKFNSEANESISKAFKEFMARVSEFEELVAVGSRLLSGFRQGLEFLRRPPIDMSSELVKSLVNANETKRLRSYLETGCIKTHDSVQNISKQVHTCHVELLDYLSKGRILLNQLESLVDDANGTLRSALGNWQPFSDRTTGEETTEEEEEVASSCNGKPEANDLALLMAIIYSMVKQDLTMQERIISALNLNSSSGELESYCLMWSLRPFINDNATDQAWKLIS